MYIHYNPNPTGQSTTDCVVRSLCKVLNRSWWDIYWELCRLGAQKGIWGDRMIVWGTYLKQHGFYRYIIPNSCPDCYSVERFTKDHPTGTYVLASDTHVVAIVDGDIYDDWDSSRVVPIYYFVKED